MRITAHRNGDYTVNLRPEEAEKLFRLIRAGRRTLCAESPNYDPCFALDLLRNLPDGSVTHMGTVET